MVKLFTFPRHHAYFLHARKGFHCKTTSSKTTKAGAVYSQKTMRGRASVQRQQSLHIPVKWQHIYKLFKKSVAIKQARRPKANNGVAGI